MRIAYICADRGIALDAQTGSAVHVRELVGALARRGHEVTVFTACAPAARGSGIPGVTVVDLAGDAVLEELRTRVAKALRASGRDALRAAEMYGLQLNERLLDALEKSGKGFDAVYERQSLWSIAGVQFARRKGVPYLLETNAPLVEQQRRYRELEFVEAAQSIETMLFTGADRIFVTTAALTGYVHERGGTRRKVRVLPCGAPAYLFDAPVRERDGKADEFVVGFLGSLKPWHGIDVLLEAFATLQHSGARYRLLIVGDGPLRAEVEETCRRRHLESVVTLAGSVDHREVGAWLARMDAGVASYPPLDSFYFSPLKIWEYAAAGVPIVASASGDLPKIFPHKVAALLHPPGSAGKLARHIQRLRENPDLAARLARRARRIARLHTWDRLAARVERAAESLVRR